LPKEKEKKYVKEVVKELELNLRQAPIKLKQNNLSALKFTSRARLLYKDLP